MRFNSRLRLYKIFSYIYKLYKTFLTALNKIFLSLFVYIIILKKSVVERTRKEKEDEKKNGEGIRKMGLRSRRRKRRRRRQGGGNNLFSWRDAALWRTRLLHFSTFLSESATFKNRFRVVPYFFYFFIFLILIIKTS